jgi:adenylosuccinate lyase
VFSQSALLALVDKGMKREDAYRVVQAASMEAWATGREFKDLLRTHPEVTNVLPSSELDALFDLQKSVRHVDYIFERAGLS